MVNSALDHFDFAFGKQTFPMRKSFLLGSDSGCFSHGKTDFFPYGYSRPEKNNAVPREERSLAGPREKLFEIMGKVLFPKAKSSCSKPLFIIFRLSMPTLFLASWPSRGPATLAVISAVEPGRSTPTGPPILYFFLVHVGHDLASKSWSPSSSPSKYRPISSFLWPTRIWPFLIKINI